MKYFIKTFGCQFNKAHGEKIARVLEKKGHRQSPAIDRANLVVILACSVRQKSVDKIFALVQNLKLKVQNCPPTIGYRRRRLRVGSSKLKIIISGCVLPSDKKKFEAMGLEVKNFKGLSRIKPQTGLVEIGQGCDNFCSYCVVPLTRGPEKYRQPKEIICEVKYLIKKGVKDITLIAQNVNSYKFQITNDKCKIAVKNSKLKNKKIICFKDLLEMVNNLKGDFKIGFLTNHPKDMPDKLIDAIAALPKIKKEVHLPLQSGSTRILRKMNRHYTKQQYLKLVGKIRKTIPNVRLTTDIIVGFPGETKKDFQDTVDVVKSARFAQAFIAKYSPREGTAAYKLKDNVPFDEKKKREQALIALIAPGC